MDLSFRLFYIGFLVIEALEEQSFIGFVIQMEHVLLGQHVRWLNSWFYIGLDEGAQDCLGSGKLVEYCELLLLVLDLVKVLLDMSFYSGVYEAHTKEHARTRNIAWAGSFLQSQFQKWGNVLFDQAQ